MATKPLAIDLYAGLGGWSEALLAEGYDVVGFDIENHQYGEHRYPGQLVLQDVLTLCGSQFRDATLIVASPPCQEYSYMAMPWSLAKAKAAAIRADTTGRMLADLNRLFDACFRIGAQASLAAGRHIPLVVENVRGAQPWVGRARWNYGSFYLWGDVPALMPFTREVKVPGFRFDGNGSFQSAAVRNNPRNAGRSFTDTAAAASGRKGIPHRTDGHWTNSAEHGRKGVGSGAEWFDQNLCSLPSASPRRKAASAMIAKIPYPLARHIAVTFYQTGIE